MGRKPKIACVHGRKTITVSGCPHCLVNALQSVNLCNMVGCSVDDLVQVLRLHYKDAEELRAAIKTANEHDAWKVGMQ